jgi:hypothetical protein
MTEHEEHQPERWLVDPAADPALRELLQAGSRERPPTRALQAAPAAVLALLALRTAGATAPVLGGAAALGARSVVTSVVLLKWFAGGVLLGAATWSLARIPETGEQRELRAPSGAGSVQRPSATVERPRSASVASASTTPEPGATARPAPSPRALSRPDVAREVALLDSTRSALLAGDARRALETLATLERLPSRALVPEATVLRVRALLAANQPELARRVARRFIDATPASPQARVLRGMFAGTASEPPRADREIQTEANGL